jgi:hypothetical protein
MVSPEGSETRLVAHRVREWVRYAGSIVITNAVECTLSASMPRFFMES